ncbi:hypothetical protein TRIATDRAFT_297125 [Trichoderma atroviride IMI 206040]|uniref:Uncharacterized protein n=1 Tax=Hypocrea atroviridis (strain ATCC 20476 / IMI 206040) TaxID=452589 RepID=G9NG06_HYPAI|nr:uncharacterized protein TRIATDRAFT_297125 [Trichoderma atroviride IMI 206040]EHK50218.1 hypothetical protein TRIATDRAFT_297125 [Trichoderma atroviride IMI 206040]
MVVKSHSNMGKSHNLVTCCGCLPFSTVSRFGILRPRLTFNCDDAEETFHDSRFELSLFAQKNRYREGFFSLFSNMEKYHASP